MDFLRWILDDEIVEVSAYVGTLNKKQANGQPVAVDYFSACILRSSQGVVGTLTAAWTFAGEEDWGSVFQCTEGTLKIYSDPEYSVIVIKKNGDIARYQPFERMVGEERHSRIVAMFVDCIEMNTDPPITGLDGLSSMRVVLACIESSRMGATVKL